MISKYSLCVLLGVASAGAASTGCHKATFINSHDTMPAEEHDRWVSFFLWGLVGSPDVNVREFCPTGEVAMVRTGGNAGTALLSSLTIGIYTPRKVYVTCAAGAAPAATTKTSRSFEIEFDGRGQPVAVLQKTADSSVWISKPILLDSSTGEWKIALRAGVSQ